MNVRRLKIKDAGLPPGTPVYTGTQEKRLAIINITGYNETEVHHDILKDPENAKSQIKPDYVNWINLDNISDVETLESIGKSFNLHPLLIEDVLNVRQRPKIEDYPGYTFIVLKMLYLNKSTKEIEKEQISLILTDSSVITFQEKAGDVFDQVRDRIEKGKGKIRKMGPDYLLYTLMDAVIDNYFIILETLSDQIEDLEDELISNPDPDTIKDINRFKRYTISLRKSIWPLREVITGFTRLDPETVSEETRIYIRDLYDHTIQVIDTVETFRDMLSGMLDIYLSSISNKMNEVMKVLTIIATIFIPLTFVTGLYGMNFEYMPELDWPWAYPVVWGLMGVIVIVMVIYFKKKKWI